MDDEEKNSKQPSQPSSLLSGQDEDNEATELEHLDFSALVDDKSEFRRVYSVDGLYLPLLQVSPVM